MQVIDAHTHILPPELIRQRTALLQRERWFGLLYANPRSKLATAEELVASMDAAGIDQSVVFGFAFEDAGLCQLCNDYVLQACQAYPGRLLPFAVANPCHGAAAVREAQRCLESGAMGVGELMPDGQGFRLADGELLRPLMELLRAHNVALMVHVNERLGHAYPGKGSQGPEEALRLATAFGENTLILPHWGGGLPFYELMPEVRAALANVYYDTSASSLLYEDRVFRHVMAWAADKVLWGSDYPLLGQARLRRRVEAQGLSAGELQQVLAGNVLRVIVRGREACR